MSLQLPVAKRHRMVRRLENIQRRLRQLDADFEAAGDMDAELRINAAIARQREYMARTMRRLEGI